MDIYRFLAENDVSYQRADHSPVYTYQEAEDRVTPLPGVHTKNLFLRDGRGRRHFLVVVEGAMRVDLKALRGMLGVDKLGMASAERLKKHLGVEPGAVTLLGVVNDRQRAVELVFDRAVWAADALQCHPLANTSTLVIARVDVERLLECTGHAWQVLAVPTVD